MATIREEQSDCTKCKHTTTKRFDPQVEHLRIDSDETPFRCDKCEYSCMIKSDLVKHMIKHTGKKVFRCDTCEYS